jgi:hypothetical protein
MRVASDIVRSIVRQLQRFRVGPAMAHSEGRDATAVMVRCPPQRSPGRHLAVSAGHVKKPDLLNTPIASGVGCNSTLDPFFAK